MSIIGLLLTAFLLAAAVACIAVKKHVPVYALAAVFCAAALSLLPILVLQHLVHSFLGSGISGQPEAVRLLFNSFITAALIEESVKAAFFCLTAAGLSKKIFGSVQGKNITVKGRDQIESTNRHVHYAIFYHSIMLAVFFGFVFSGFENISYSLRYSGLQFLRLFTASLLHGMLGCFYASMAFAETKRKAALICAAAVLLHGLYNFFISLGGGFILPAAAILGIVCLYAGRVFDNATQAGT